MPFVIILLAVVAFFVVYVAVRVLAGVLRTARVTASGTVSWMNGSALRLASVCSIFLLGFILFT